MKKGFTLVELVIVIVIIGVLSIIAVPIYRGYILKAEQSEAKALVGAIKTAQAVYYAEHGEYYTVARTQYDDVLGIDARSNKYYAYFQSTASGWHPGAWAATAVRSMAGGFGNVNGDSIILYWAIDPSVPIMAPGGHKTPFYRYQDKDGNMIYSQS